ncbi:MAG: MBL fold metallo-hydrolase [Deltaproteobacteria bacterium]|nr:MBL fold metallo-hydrolase [Deltaproteobacteria bacterium]
MTLAALVIAGCAGGLYTPTRPADPPALDAAFFASKDEGPRMRVHLIDVGQGAATLIEFSCAAVLIDTGGESNKRHDSTKNLVEYLNAFFQSRPDLDRTLALMVLTHPHIDHTRGAPVVFGEFTVKNLVTDGLTNSSGGKEQGQVIRAAKRANIGVEAVDARAVKSGGLTSPVIDPVACEDGDPDIRVLWGSPARTDVNWLKKEYDNGNNHSVVVKVTLGKSSLMITGDLEEDGIDAMLERHKNTSALDADVYQVGHHGSYNATTKSLLRAISPKVALIAAGPAWRKQSWSAFAYGHPRLVTVELLEAALTGPPRGATVRALGVRGRQFEPREMTAPIYTSAWDSDVIVTMFADGRLAVKTRRGS